MSARWWAPGLLVIVFAGFAPEPCPGDPIFSFGGGFADDETFRDEADPVPFGWLGFRTRSSTPLSAFLRVAYERASAPVSLVSLDFPASRGDRWRVTYIPIGCGLRWSGGSEAHTQAFAEAGSCATWGRFERDLLVFTPYDNLQREVRHSEHWLAGVELAAGMHHAINATAGIEWGFRFSQWTAPPRSIATEGADSGGLRRFALIAGLTLTPSGSDLLARHR